MYCEAAFFYDYYCSDKNKNKNNKNNNNNNKS